MSQDLSILGFNSSQISPAEAYDKWQALHIASLSMLSGGVAPTHTEPFMPWWDTATGVRKRRNAANTAWVSESIIDARIVTTGGTGAAYTVDFDPPISAYSDIQGLTFKVGAHIANALGATAALNGLPPLDIQRLDGSPIAAGNIPVGYVPELFFNGVDLTLLNPFGFDAAQMNSGRLHVDRLPIGTRYVPMSIPEVLSYNASAAQTWDVFSLDSILSGTGAVFAHLWIQNRSTTVGAPPESRGVYARAIAEGTATTSSPGELVGIQTTSDYHWGFRSRTIPLNALNQILLRTTWATIFPEADVLVIGYYV